MRHTAKKLCAAALSGALALGMMPMAAIAENTVGTVQTGATSTEKSAADVGASGNDGQGAAAEDDAASAQLAADKDSKGSAAVEGDGVGLESAESSVSDSAEAAADSEKEADDTEPAASSDTAQPTVTVTDSVSGAEAQTESSIVSYDEFLFSLNVLEGYADTYANEHSGEDANALIINFIRTGVERYTTSAWTTFCGPENTSFTSYVALQDKANNTNASALRNIDQFTLPNGNEADFGHMFGCLDMAYHTKNQSTADLGSWAGDLADLVWLVTTTGIDSGTVDQMAEAIRTQTDKYFLHAMPSGDGSHSFSQTDLYGDLDSFYILKSLESNSSLATIVRNYFTSALTDKIRARFFLENRLGGVSAQDDIRNDIYDLYKGNQGILTLEGTYLSQGVDDNIRKASCYAFADWLYLTAYDQDAASYYKVFSSESSTLAPGVTQVEKRALTTDNKQIVYYLATADISRNDVSIYANYKDNDGSSWGMQRVSEQMQAAEKRHGDSGDIASYIPNYKAVVGINGDFYNMSNGAPSGALVMNGIQYNGVGNENFFAILKDGSAIIGTAGDWASYKDQIQEAVGASVILVKDGKMAVSAGSNYYDDRASRTCVGITYDGKVVFMVLDGRQEPFSAGGSAQEIAQIMIDAGCVTAVNLDGGGSSTFVSKAEGSDTATVVNRPSDGYERSVSSSLMIVSTAQPSTEFDHAVLSSDYDYLTVGTSLDITASGVSATGDSVHLPAGTTLKVSDAAIGTIAGSTFTAASLGDVTVQLVASDGSTVLGSKTLHVVEPTDLKFTKQSINSIYGEPTDLPLEATCNGNPVKINDGDVTFGYLKETLQPLGSAEGTTVNTTKTELVFDYPEAGSIDSFRFTPAADSNLRTLTVGAVLTSKMKAFTDTINSEYAAAYKTAIANGASEESAAVSARTSAINKALATAARLEVYMYKSGEATLDFDTADGKDSSGMLAWKREVADSTYNPDETYYVLKDHDAMGEIDYTLAFDMSKVSIPQKLSGLLYMLPGGDQEGRTAWDFMLQLAERISPLTTVTLNLTVPDGFTVDTSELRLANDFFKLNSATLSGNTLTITFGFVAQTEPVNPATANPICVLSGLRLIPSKSAPWDENGFLSCGLSGKASYDIYAHFHILKSLASQTEYQEKYGLYPYDNSTNQSGDYGAHFSNDILSFADTCRLKRNLKQGWLRENGAWSYYDENGELLTGVQELPSFVNGDEGTYWYDLGQNGSCTDTYTGLFQKDGKTFYSRFGVLASGWQAIQDDAAATHTYYFDPTTFAAATGETVVGGLTYTFNEKGQLIRGAFYSDGTGTRYNWAGRDLWRQFVTLDEGTYWIDANKHVAYGNDHTVTTNVKDVTWYHFDEKTGIMTGVCSGIFSYDGAFYYADENGKVVYGAVKTDDGIVFSATLGKLLAGEGVYIDATTTQVGCALASGWYYADDDGRLIKDGFATVNGNIYHYSGYQIDKGFVKIDDSYYLFNAGSGKMYTDATMWVGDNSYGVEAGLHRFGTDGKMELPNGWTSETLKDGKTYTYYYINGEKAKGLTKIGDDYYFFNKSSGMLYKNAELWVAGENDYGLAGGMYQFDADGRMQLKNGFVTENGYTYYYVDGKRITGFTKIGDDYYLFNAASGMMYADGSYWVPDNVYGFAGGMYRFGVDGKLKLQNGFVNESHKDGKTYTYYYINGEKAKGLTKIGDDYYFFNKSSGMMYRDCVVWISADNTCGFAAGMYRLDADGSMQGVA